MIEVLHKALKFYGETEIVGNEDNPVILDWFHETGHKWVKHDEVANCAVFIQYCALVTGYEHTDDLLARSWLEVGIPVIKPELGNIVVFWRKSKDSIWGHVGLYINQIGTGIYTLGANQGNKVCVKPYPESQLLGYRVLRKAI